MLLKATRNKNKKRNKIVMLARSKLNRIESKISQALINNQISHEDFITCAYVVVKNQILLKNKQQKDY